MNNEILEGMIKWMEIGGEFRRLNRRKPVFKPNIIMSKEFKWTDDLVKEFCNWFTRIPSYEVFKKDRMDEFKSSHSKEDRDPEWEIVSFRTKEGPLYQYDSKEKFDKFYQGEMDWYKDNMVEKYLAKDDWEINSVRRLLDNEIFTVGDQCFHGPIVRFNLQNDKITADFECGDVGCTVSLSDLSKLPQRTKLFTVELTQEQINKLLKLLE